MKVLLINGSPRANGNTARALKEVADTLAAEGIETETVWIGKKPVRGCCACYQCGQKSLGRNMAWLLKNLKRGDAVPRHADEPWQPMHFIR